MSTTYDTTGLPRTFAPIKPVGFFERFRVAFREWRERWRHRSPYPSLSRRYGNLRQSQRGPKPPGWQYLSLSWSDLL